MTEIPLSFGNIRNIQSLMKKLKQLIRNLLGGSGRIALA
jgi:hypothetical protein